MDNLIQCWDCGKYFSEDEIFEVPDPYIMNLFGEEFIVCLCEDCYDEAVFSI